MSNNVASSQAKAGRRVIAVRTDVAVLADVRPWLGDSGGGLWHDELVPLHLTIARAGARSGAAGTSDQYLSLGALVADV